MVTNLPRLGVPVLIVFNDGRLPEEIVSKHLQNSIEGSGVKDPHTSLSFKKTLKNEIDFV